MLSFAATISSRSDSTVTPTVARYRDSTESICRTSVPHCGFAVAHKAANRHTAVRQPYAAIRRTVSAVISGLRILKSEIVDFDVAAARSLERFKADAEPKLERLAEIENEYDLRRFSKIQLRYMLLCLCEESVGNVGIEKEWGDPVADYLVDAGVFFKTSEAADPLKDVYSLAPEWRRFVSANEAEVRSMVGGDGVPAASSTR